MGRLDHLLSLAVGLPRWHVYAITGADNVPVYVGSSQYPERRFYGHSQAEHNLGLRAWMASTLHRMEILDSFHTKREMLDAEKEYISYIKPVHNLDWTDQFV